MDVVLYQFLTDVPRAVAIWSALLVLALTVLTVLVSRPERETPAAETRPEPTTPSTEEADLLRYAEEVAVAAAGAAQTARRRREGWLAAQDQAEAAWQQYDEADAVARRFAAAAALPTPRTPHTPAEYAARERHLHRAATAAYWRGELPVGELGDVFAHRNGWDPRLHPVDQEVLLHRVVRDRRLAAYRVAAERERAAWRTAELAASSARSLALEAYAAAERVRQVRHAALPAVRRSPRSRPARPTRAAARWRPARAS